MKTLSAIPIRDPWIDLILKGFKMWEIRSKFTKKIGPVALIRSGSGTVVGTATLSEVISLTNELAFENQDKMGFQGLPKEKFKGSEGEYAWVLKDVIKLNKPVPYKHPPGAVTWVTLDESTTEQVLLEAKLSEKIEYVPYNPSLNH